MQEFCCELGESFPIFLKAPEKLFGAHQHFLLTRKHQCYHRGQATAKNFLAHVHAQLYYDNSGDLVRFLQHKHPVIVAYAALQGYITHTKMLFRLAQMRTDDLPGPFSEVIKELHGWLVKENNMWDCNCPVPPGAPVFTLWNEYLQSVHALIAANALLEIPDKSPALWASVETLLRMAASGTIEPVIHGEKYLKLGPCQSEAQVPDSVFVVSIPAGDVRIPHGSSPYFDLDLTPLIDCDLYTEKDWYAGLAECCRVTLGVPNDTDTVQLLPCGVKANTTGPRQLYYALGPIVGLNVLNVAGVTLDHTAAFVAVHAALGKLIIAAMLMDFSGKLDYAYNTLNKASDQCSDTLWSKVVVQALAALCSLFTLDDVDYEMFVVNIYVPSNALGDLSKLGTTLVKCPHMDLFAFLMSLWCQDFRFVMGAQALPIGARLTLIVQCMVIMDSGCTSTVLTALANVVAGMIFELYSKQLLACYEASCAKIVLEGPVIEAIAAKYLQAIAHFVMRLTHVCALPKVFESIPRSRVAMTNTTSFKRRVVNTVALLMRRPTCVAWS